ncbi:MAG: CBS domain-containing protein [Halioglobus sp.]|nr:CBS domain-containing protein [Halioglobus sp.]
MQVKHVMRRLVHTVRSEDTLKTAALNMANNNISLLPVVDEAMVEDKHLPGEVVANIGFHPLVEEDVLVGVLTSRDIATRAVAYDKQPDKTRVADVMSRDFACCKEDDDVDAALAVMEDRQVRRLLVVNREQQFVGLVSRHDLWRAKSADSGAVPAKTPAS